MRPKKNGFFFLKRQLIDENRMNSLKERSPEEFRSLQIKLGINFHVDINMGAGSIELPKDKQTDKNVYIRMTTDSNFDNWDCREIQPRSERDKLMVEIPLRGDNSV